MSLTDAPFARKSRMSETQIRCPRMHGFPKQMSGLMLIRSSNSSRPINVSCNSGLQFLLYLPLMYCVRFSTGTSSLKMLYRRAVGNFLIGALGNRYLLDLVAAFNDFHDLGVAIEAFCRIVAAASVCAVDLDCVAGNLGGGPAGEVFGNRGLRH